MSKKYEAYEKVKSLILNHQLSPGQKLIYRDLEEKIGMTKTPIINGLIMLEKEGFVIAKKNRGFYCSEINSGEAKQIFDLREKLENLAVEYAVGNYIKEDLEILKRKLKEYDAYPSLIYDNKRLFLDTGFHLQIAMMGKNPFLFEILKQFYENVYFKLDVAYLTPGIKKFKKEHNILFEAIKKKDLRLAKRILRDHNRLGKEFFCSMNLVPSF